MLIVCNHPGEEKRMSLPDQLNYAKLVRNTELALTLLADQLHVGAKILSISRDCDDLWQMVTASAGQMLGDLSLEERRKVKEETLRLLGRLHQFGILHRDITEENIVVHQGVVSIIDYGLAVLCTPELDLIRTAREVFDVALVNATLDDLFTLERKETEKLFYDSPSSIQLQRHSE